MTSKMLDDLKPVFFSILRDEGRTHTFLVFFLVFVFVRPAAPPAGSPHHPVEGVFAAALANQNISYIGEAKPMYR